MGGLLAALMEHAGSLAQVAVGGLTGIVASGVLIAAGVVPFREAATPPAQLALVQCPGSGAVVAVAQAGEQMLVTGRSADGAWLQVFVPGPVSSEGWVRSDSIRLLANGSGLPIASCGAVADARSTESQAPTATPSIATAAPTSSPTVAPRSTNAAATPTPAAVATPNAGPVFSAQPSANPSTIAFRPLGLGSCATSGAVKTAASDPDGVAQVQLRVKEPGAASFARLAHDFVRAGTTWNNTIETARDGIASEGTLSFYAVAIDAKGAKTTSKVNSIKVIRCDTEASIPGGIDAPLIDGQREIFCVLIWEFAIADPDGLRGASIIYSIPPGTPPLTKPIPLKLEAGTTNVWTARTTFVPHGVFTVAWTLTTTDAFGGTTSLSRTEVVHYQCVT